MKFHPFNIKYVEKINDSNKIIFHDDICYENFYLKMNKNFGLTQSYRDESKNINNIYGLMHTDISCYVKNQKDFLLHGDIYFLKEYNDYVIFSFIKYENSSSIKNHGFFFLNEKLINNDLQLIFNHKDFKNLDKFFNDYLEKESDFEYIGNLFIHDVEDFMPEPFSFDKTYKVDFLKEKIDSNDNFYHHSNFILLEKQRYETVTHTYEPKIITPELVKLNESGCWEFSLERFVKLYSYTINLLTQSSIELITGYLYECVLDESIINVIKKNTNHKDKKRIFNYMKFFVFYTHKGISIQSIVNDSLEDFYFDDIPIGFDAWDSFKILSNRNDSLYKEELLKII